MCVNYTTEVSLFSTSHFATADYFKFLSIHSIVFYTISATDVELNHTHTHTHNKATSDCA